MYINYIFCVYNLYKLEKIIEKIIEKISSLLTYRAKIFL